MAFKYSGAKSLTITIPLEEYQQLTADSKELAALHAAGVDNWEGYGEAFDNEEEDDS